MTCFSEIYLSGDNHFESVTVEINLMFVHSDRLTLLVRNVARPKQGTCNVVLYSVMNEFHLQLQKNHCCCCSSTGFHILITL